MSSQGGGIDGLGVGLMGAGAILVYAGWKNVSMLGLLQGFVRGETLKNAAAGAGSLNAGIDTGTGSTTTASSSATSGGGSVTAAGGEPTGSAEKLNQATGKLVASTYGWFPGDQWTAFNNVVMAESGWNATISNPNSGAFGIAQALGHGTSAEAGTYGDNYGGFGLSTSDAISANNGNAAEQIYWMLNYIKQTYGTPEAAWKHEQSDAWY